MMTSEEKKKLEALEREIAELKDFKKKIELGSRWLWCSFYVIGAAIVFGYQTYEFFLKHFMFKTN